METAAVETQAGAARVRAAAHHLLVALDRMHGREHLSLNVTSAIADLRHTLGETGPAADRWRGPL